MELKHHLKGNRYFKYELFLELIFFNVAVSEMRSTEDGAEMGAAWPHHALETAEHSAVEERRPELEHVVASLECY